MNLMLVKGGGMMNASAVRGKTSLQYPELLLMDIVVPVIMGV